MTNKYSIYKYTPSNGFERGYFVPPEIPLDDTTDYYFEVPDGYNHKPGNMAHDLYGSAKLYWIFAYFNKEKIVDPIFDIKTGVQLRIPDKQRLLSYF